MNNVLRISVMVISMLAGTAVVYAQWTRVSAPNGETALGQGGVSRTSSILYDVAQWQGFRSAAVSYTFDDNCPNQLAIAIPMFDQFGFKLTLFTVTSSSWGWRADWIGLQNAASRGHEIASHTIDHQSLGGLSDAQQQTELQVSRDTINAHITGQACLTFAYPNCVTGNSTLVKSLYIAARGCSGQIVSTTPGDFMNISSFVLGNQGLNTADAIENQANNAVTANGWCVYLIHGINGTEPGAYSPISQDIMLATLQYFSANPNKFWVAPFGTVARYVQERNAARVSEISANADSITAQVSDTVDNIYTRVSLTLRRPLPNGWDSVIVRQGGVTVSSKKIRIDTVTYVVFDAVPNAGILTIINKTGTRVGVRNESSPPNTFGLLQNYPNPFNPTTNLEFQVASLGFVSLEIFDPLGRKMATLLSEQRPAGSYTVKWDAHNLPSGVYFYRLRAGPFVDTKKLLLLK